MASEITQDNQQQYILFSLNKEQILISISSIQLVLLLPSLQSIPNQDPAFKGLLDFHGKSIPVYDLAKLINDQHFVDVTISTSVMICKTHSGLVALMVDDVVEVLQINDALLQNPEKDAMPFVKFIVEKESMMAWGLNLDTLVAHHRLQLKHETPHE